MGRGRRGHGSWEGRKEVRRKRGRKKHREVRKEEGVGVRFRERENDGSIKEIEARRGSRRRMERNEI